MDLLSEGYRPRGRRPVAGAVGATCEALIAAFCRREKSLSCCWEKGWLVGAVGIESNEKLYLKDLRGMHW